MEETESEDEKEQENVEEKELREPAPETPYKITFAAILRRIIQSNVPLSGTHPGYLFGFLSMLQTTDSPLPAQLENSLHGFQKAGQIWNSSIGRASKKGVIEYLESVPSLMGNWFAMFFDSKTLESVKTFLVAYGTMNITEEDCCRYVEKITTSTSSTTASSATARVGATGSKRQKLMGPTVDEIDVLIDEIPVEVEQQPIFKTYSSIIARKDDYNISKNSRTSGKTFKRGLQSIDVKT